MSLDNCRVKLNRRCARRTHQTRWNPRSLGYAKRSKCGTALVMKNVHFDLLAVGYFKCDWR